jgi:hypothetical protein
MEKFWGPKLKRVNRNVRNLSTCCVGAFGIRSAGGEFPD